MAVIDADCHTIETEDTWSYMTGEEQQYRPRVLEASGRPGSRRDEMWFYDNTLTNKRAFPPDKSRVSAESAQMQDIETRLKDMDQFGVDIQVLYPTVLLGAAAMARRETQVAMCKAYNRWVTERVKETKGRLRWVAALPYETMDEALKELEWCKANGACGVLMHGLLRDRTVVDNYYFPVYSAAEAMDLPITIHSGLRNHSFEGIFHSRSTGIWNAKFPVIGSMHALFQSSIPAKYPRLRWGFVEAAASWVPYLLTDLTARSQRMGRSEFSAQDALRRNRFYVTCQTEEDLPYILKWAGEESLVIGSDYSHADTSSELEALAILRQREDITPDQKKKILEDNPAALYGF